ncbi:MAG: hypothetical protein KA149_00450 [Chitinophagales bacterium]|nr:hypothetical protein [Chitinophagales bacterium]
MKSIACGVFFCLLLLFACQRNHPLNRNIVTPQGDTTFIIDNHVFPYNDTNLVDYPEFNWEAYKEGDSIFETTLNTKDTFKCVLYPSDDKKPSEFYRLKAGKWKNIGTHKNDRHDFWEFVDLNFDGVGEAIATTARNMNGNTFKQVYIYDSINDKMLAAGTISDRLILNKKSKEIYETYEGSWYMTASQTIYQWQGNSLLPVKQITLGPKNENAASDSPFVYCFYEQPELGGPLVLKWEKAALEDTEQSELWDSFFPSTIYP